MSLKKDLKHSGFWQTLEVAGLFIIQFVYVAIMARLLDKADFGLMAIANSFVAFGYIFAESGMGAALIQRKELTEKHINAAIQGGVLFGILLFVIFIFSAPFVAGFFGQPELNNLVKVIAINFLLLSVSSVSLGLLHRSFKFKQSSLVTIIAVTISYGTGVILGYQGYGVWSLVIASILFSVLKLLGYLWYAPVKLIKGIFLKEWKELFSFGFGMMLLKMNLYISSNGIILVLGNILGASLLGVFERSLKIKKLPSKILGDVLDKIMFPAMSKIQHETDKLFHVYQHSLGFVNSIQMPLSFFLIFFSSEIVHILLGADWVEAIIPLQIMFVVLALNTSGRMADSVIRARGLIYQNAWRKFIYVIVLLASVSYGAMNYGIIGAAVGVSVSNLFNYITMLFLVKKVFNKGIIEIFFKPLFTGLLLTLFVALFLIAYSTHFGLWGETNIIHFLFLSVMMGSVLAVILYKKPYWLGSYIGKTVTELK